MRAFVTGGTGFLGSHLVDQLLQEGCEVTCLVRPSSDLRWLKTKKVRFVQGDLLPDNRGLREGLKDVDFCFHVAGLVSASNPKQYFQVNAGGTRHCLDMCLKVAPNLKRFVLISSVAASGPAIDGVPLNETTEPKPITLYGQSKLEGEKIALTYRSKIPLTVIRPPAIYGARDSMLYPVFKMAKRHLFLVPGKKRRYVTMVYVEDVASACIWATQSRKAVGEVFFISDGDLYCWQDVADAMAHTFHHSVFKIPVPKTLLWPLALLEETRSKWFHQTPRLSRGHVNQFFRSSWGIDIQKIKKAGFNPRFNLESGMEATVAGYRQIGWL